MARHKHPKVIVRKLGKEQAHGTYDPDKKIIEVDERVNGKGKVYVYVHEYFHHLFPYMSEEDVTKKSKSITDFLWQHGFRFVDNHKNEL